MGEKKADPCFLVRGAGGGVEHVLCKLAVDDRWVSDLLQSDNIKREQATVCKDRRELARKGEADIKRSKAEGG